VLLVVGLLGLGLLALLLLNTASAQDAFQLSDLQRQSKALGDQQQSLSRQASQLSDPASVAAAAAKLGMIPGAVPIFLAPGQKAPAGENVDGLIIVPAPRPAQPAQQTQPAVTAPAKQTQPASKKPASSTTKPPPPNTPATTGQPLPPAVLNYFNNLRKFQQFANGITAQQQAAKNATKTPSPGTHP
jgi:hypothetical protein